MSAGRVIDPDQYRWSSYRHNGLGQADERLTPHAEYLALGQTDLDWRATCRTLSRTELDEAAVADIRVALGQGQTLGSNRFSASLCEAEQRRRTASPLRQRAGS